MVRALSKTYTGPLYQVRSGSSAMNTGSGGTTKDIGMTADGFADTATQDAFCRHHLHGLAPVRPVRERNNLKVANARASPPAERYSATDDFESSATKSR